MDFANQKARKVGVFTDKTIAKLLPMQMALESLEENGIKYEVFDKTRVEPNQQSWEEAIAFAKEHDFSHFLAVGGGSVIDTCKVANLFTCYPDADLYDFINAPIGKGQPIQKTLRPLIAVPTTAGTGSETTGTAIADLPHLRAKTGIASRALRPLLGIVDPLNTDSCPREVHISSGLDVLFHALESWTAVPYTERTPRPSNPMLRPAYQGSNPISDVFSEWALRQTVKYLPRIAADQGDREAKSQMLLASTFAGIGFGNAGVHICHGASYAISSLNYVKAKYQHPGYQVDHPLVPHGVAVAMTGPSVFSFTAPTAPSRHRTVAAIFEELATPQNKDHIDTARVSDADLGPLLFDRIARFLVSLDVPRGLKALGYKSGDVDELVKGTLPQRRVLDLAPGFSGNDGREELSRIIEGASLVNHLLNEPSRNPAAHKLVSPELSVSLSFSPDSANTLGPCSPSDTAAVLQALKAVGDATRAVDLVWIPHFRRVEPTSLVAASGVQVAREEPAHAIRTDQVESWKAEVEWTLVYEPPPTSMHAGTAAAAPGKRFKLWTSAPRTVHLVFAFDSGQAEAESGEEQPTQAGARGGLVSLEYALGALPPPVALWTSLGAIPCDRLQQLLLRSCESVLLALVRLGVSICTDPSETAAAGPLNLPDPEAPSPPIHLRHHPRHYESELQAEPPLASSSDVMGTRRRWSVGSLRARSGLADPETPATLSAAAHLHLERPLKERHPHRDPVNYSSESADSQSALSSEARSGRSAFDLIPSLVHEPSHAHPMRVHRNPPEERTRHHHHHHHRHHPVGGGFVFRVLSLPRRLIAVLVQIVQIIVVDFLALGDVFHSLIEVVVAYLQQHQPAEAEETGHGEGGPPGTEPTTPAKRVSFVEEEGAETPDKSAQVEGYTLPLNPPPSPHLPPISEASSAASSSSLTSSPSRDGGAGQAAPDLDKWVATTFPDPRSSPTLRPSGLVRSLPIPSDVDALALALHQQLAHAAAAQAQAHFESAPAPSSERALLGVGARMWMAHDVVASEAASRAREPDHVERMAGRYAAPGGRELGESVEQQQQGTAVPRAPQEENASMSSSVSLPLARLAPEPVPARQRPELRKTVSASTRSTAAPERESASPTVTLSAGKAESEALEDRLGLIMYEPVIFEETPPPAARLASTSEERDDDDGGGTVGDPAIARAHLTTPGPPRPVRPGIHRARSYDPSERGIGIARAFSQGQGPSGSPGPVRRAVAEGEGEGIEEEGSLERVAVGGPEAWTPEVGTMEQGEEQEEEGERSIDPTTLIAPSEPAAAAVEDEEKKEKGPTSVPMQHELSASGPFTSSQGTPRSQCEFEDQGGRAESRAGPGLDPPADQAAAGAPSRRPQLEEEQEQGPEATSAVSPAGSLSGSVPPSSTKPSGSGSGSGGPGSPLKHSKRRKKKKKAKQT
ncbi:hypothetical protein JCM3774_005221 [Rhodotorula dairenensis]